MPGGREGPGGAGVAASPRSHLWHEPFGMSPGGFTEWLEPISVCVSWAESCPKDQAEVWAQAEWG